MQANKTAKDLRDAFFQLFSHIIGDHEHCTASCPHLEVEAWQKNDEFRAQVHALEIFLKQKMPIAEFERVLDGGHTHRIESYFAYLLWRRPKNVHFPIATCRARCDSGYLDWNSNPRHISDVSRAQSDHGYEGELRYRMEWRKRAREGCYYE